MIREEICTNSKLWNNLFLVHAVKINLVTITDMLSRRSVEFRPNIKSRWEYSSTVNPFSIILSNCSVNSCSFISACCLIVKWSKYGIFGNMLLRLHVLHPPMHIFGGEDNEIKVIFPRDEYLIPERCAELAKSYEIYSWVRFCLDETLNDLLCSTVFQ